MNLNMHQVLRICTKFHDLSTMDKERVTCYFNANVDRKDLPKGPYVSVIKFLEFVEGIILTDLQTEVRDSLHDLCAPIDNFKLTDKEEPF